MNCTQRHFSILYIIISIFISSTGVSQNYMKELLQEVKEASYYDSASVFQAGSKILEIVKNQNSSIERAEVYLYYGSHYYYTRNLEIAKMYFERALHEAEAANSEHLALMAKIRLLYISSETEDFSKIENELSELSVRAAELKDQIVIVEIINMRGILNEKNGNPKITANLYLDGLQIAKANHLDYYEATFHNNLGLLKFSLENVDDALLDFSEVIKIAKKIKNPRLLSHAQLNLSLVLVAQKNYKEANELFSMVISYAATNNHPEELANAYGNLANAYVDNKDYKTGLLYLDSSLIILKKYQLKEPLIISYLNKGQIMTELNDLKTAEKSLLLADQLLSKDINTDVLAEFYFSWYKLYSAKKEYMKALDFHLKFTAVKNGLQQKLNTKTLEGLQLKYNVQQKEIELEKEISKSIILKKDHEKDIYLRWIFLSSFILLLFSAIAYFYVRYHRTVSEQQNKFSGQLIKNLEEERSRIARDLHDDIGQSLSILKSKFTHKNEFENSNFINKEIERVIEQTRQISKNLYPSYLEKIGLNRAISGLSEAVQNSNQIECSYEVDGEADVLPIETATHVYRIIQECLNNTIKHSKATALKISLIHEEEVYHLLYMDNGNFKKSNKNEYGLGLLSISERAKLINGVLQIEENNVKGFKLSLKFKLKSQ